MSELVAAPLEWPPAAGEDAGDANFRNGGSSVAPSPSSSSSVLASSQWWPSSGNAGGKRGVQKLIRSAFRRGGDRAAASDAGGGGIGAEPGSARAVGAASSRPPAGRNKHGGGGGGGIGLMGPKSSKAALLVLDIAKLQHAYLSYPWEKRMREMASSSSNSYLSLLLLPKASDPTAARYNSVDDTLARANAWLGSARASGVPIEFVNVQTESLLTKISGETASSTVNMGSLADLANMANASLYGFEDYHGVDIGVVRAIRLWFAPIAGEVALEIKLQLGDTKLGFAISRTEEGFIYISSVAEGDAATPSARSGLRELYKEAKNASKLLVVSRVGGEKVLPWMVSTSGDVKCFDTVSLSQKLSLHRHALRPIPLHFFAWDDASVSSVVERTAPEVAMPPTAVGGTPDEVLRAMRFGSGSDVGSRRESSVGDSSFRFQNISLPDSWV